jgi:HEAT repeat protein
MYGDAPGCLQAIDTLRDIGQHAIAPALPLLEAALQDDDCVTALEQLRDFCKHAESAVHLLVKVALQHKDEDIRQDARIMLGKLDQHAASHAFPVLTDALQDDDDDDVCRRATELFGDLREHASAPQTR